MHHVAILFDRVPAFHSFEHVVAAVLQRHVQVTRHLRQVADRLQQIVAHVLGEVRHELDPLNSRRVVNRQEQIRHPRQLAVRRVLEAVDRLAQQRDLADPLIGECLHFPDDVSHRT